MFDKVQILSESSRVATTETQKDPKKEYNVVQAEVNGRRINVYFPLDETGKDIGTAIIDNSTADLTAVYSKANLFDQIKPNAQKRDMTPSQIGEDDFKLRTYQILTETYLSRFSRSAKVKLSNKWTSVKSAVNSSKKFYNDHPAAFRRVFLVTAFSVVGIASFYIQRTYNSVGMLGKFWGNSNS